MSRTLEVLAVGSQHGVVECVQVCLQSPVALSLQHMACLGLQLSFALYLDQPNPLHAFQVRMRYQWKTLFFFLILKMIEKRLEEQHQIKAHLQVWKWQCLNADSQHRNPVTLLTQAFINRYLVPIWCCNKSLHLVANAVFHCFWVTENVNFLTFKRWMCTVRLA